MMTYYTEVLFSRLPNPKFGALEVRRGFGRELERLDLGLEFHG